MAAMRNPRDGFLRLNRFSLNDSIFDFGTTIGCVNCTLTFYCCSHKYQFGEANSTDFLALDNTEKGAAIFTT